MSNNYCSINLYRYFQKHFEEFKELVKPFFVDRFAVESDRVFKLGACNNNKTCYKYYSIKVTDNGSYKVEPREKW